MCFPLGQKSPKERALKREQSKPGSWSRRPYGALNPSYSVMCSQLVCSRRSKEGQPLPHDQAQREDVRLGTQLPAPRASSRLASLEALPYAALSLALEIPNEGVSSPHEVRPSVTIRYRDLRLGLSCLLLERALARLASLEALGSKRGSLKSPRGQTSLNEVGEGGLEGRGEVEVEEALVARR